MRNPLTDWMLALLLAGLLATGCTSGKTPSAQTNSENSGDQPVPEASDPARAGASHASSHPKFRLQLDKAWQLNSPDGQRFDASGLLMRTNGDLLTLNDRGATLFRIEFVPGLNAANLVPVPGWFTPDQLTRLGPSRHGRLDCEGIAEDAQGRIYVCEEDNRWILRFDPATQKIERLEISWKPVKKYFDTHNHNASFEGVAVGPDRLYVANERSQGRIIVVDLATLRVVDDFTTGSRRWHAKDVHYSDLSWQGGHLWALLREKHVILKLNPATHAILGEFDFSQIEDRPELDYHTRSGTGVMEGLAVTAEHFWLVTDNNGLPRKNFPQDSRPTLLKCPRPDR